MTEPFSDLAGIGRQPRLAQKVVGFVSLSQKSNLRIGFRCHSGRHRSVATAELLSLLLKRLVTAVEAVTIRNK